MTAKGMELCSARTCNKSHLFADSQPSTLSATKHIINGKSYVNALAYL